MLSIPIRVILTVAGLVFVFIRIIQLLFDFLSQSPDSRLGLLDFALPGLISILSAVGFLIVINYNSDSIESSKDKRIQRIISWSLMGLIIIYSLVWQAKYLDWQSNKYSSMTENILEISPIIFCGLCSLFFLGYSMKKIKNAL